MATVSVMVADSERAAAADYEGRLRAVVEVHGGVDEGAVGEGRLFAFSGARDALRCAVAVQRDLAGDGAAASRIRMAVHSGEGERDNGALRGRVVLKAARSAEVDSLLGAIRRVARGGCMVDPALADLLVARADARGSLSELTEREREVLGLLAQGLSNAAIAEQLVVTGRTVETHGDSGNPAGGRSPRAPTRRAS